MTKAKTCKIVVIVGPTASGKTAFAIRLAKKLDGEVISADSRQVYRGMDIGTAKPKLVRKSGALFSESIRHHLMDICDINQPFTAKDFKTLAERAIRDISKRNKLPMVVGGTGLYIKALVENLNLTATPPNAGLRRKLESELKKYGPPRLYSKLVKLDPEAAYIVDSKNPRRVIRALEIALASKKPLAEVRSSGQSPFDILEIGINRPREELKRKIEKRVIEMIKTGLIAEAKKLVAAYPQKPEPFSAIGYREIIDYLENKIPLDEAVRQIQSSTWRYAKKQIAWFKKDPRVIWVSSQKQAKALVKNFLKTQS